MKMHFFDQSLNRRQDATPIPEEVKHTTIVLVPNESVCVVLGDTVVALRYNATQRGCVQGHMRLQMHPSYIDGMVKGLASGVGLIE